jgi:hypothetical protein
MSAADTKAAIKELKGQIKTATADQKAADKAHAVIVKAYDKDAKARQKILDGLNAKLAKLQPAE